MLDLGKITETITGLLAGGWVPEAVDPPGDRGLVPGSDLRPAMFEGLTQDEILHRLQGHEPDSAGWGGGQMAGFLASPGGGERINSFACGWFDHGRPSWRA